MGRVVQVRRGQGEPRGAAGCDQSLDDDGERLTSGLKHKVPGIVCNLDYFIFVFKDVSRQKDFSRIDSKETRILAAAHAEAVSINSGRPGSMLTGFFIGELCADRAKAIDIELFQVGSDASRRPTRRKNGQQGARWTAGGLFEEYPAAAVIDRGYMGPSSAGRCSQRAVQIGLVLMKQHLKSHFLRRLSPSSDFHLRWRSRTFLAATTVRLVVSGVMSVRYRTYSAHKRRATLNPRSTTRVSSLSQSRYAARRPVGVEIQDPPRLLRHAHAAVTLGEPSAGAS